MRSYMSFVLINLPAQHSMHIAFSWKRSKTGFSADIPDLAIRFPIKVSVVQHTHEQFLIGGMGILDHGTEAGAEGSQTAGGHTVQYSLDVSVGDSSKEESDYL